MANRETDAETLNVLKRLLRDKGRAYAPKYALAFVFMALTGGATAASAWMMRDVINRIFVNHEPDALIWVPAAVIAIFCVKGLATYYQEVTLAGIGNRVVAEAQQKMFDHLLKMDIGFYQSHASGDLIARITSGASAARDMLKIVALGAGRDLFTLLSLLVVMVTQDALMTVIALTTGPFIAVVVTRLVRRVRSVAHRGIVSNGNIVSTLREAAQGISIVKAFQLEDHLRSRMSEAISSVELMSNKMARLQARVAPIVETLGGLAIAAVIFYAGWRNLKFGDTPGQFFAFITALLLAGDPARRLSRVRVQLASAAVGVRLMYDLMDVPVKEDEPPGTPALLIKRGEIRFDRVSFAYREPLKVLDELCFVAPGGSTTALVGLSGSGKSTIFSLLQRFWAPSSGSITIDDQPIARTSLRSLRRQIALVSQDVFLFEGTIRDNIKAGMAGVSDGALLAAAKAAHVDGFIGNLTKGFDTPVGELGSQVSGGQRQRISIARAFLKNAPILLLDEPTSALDSEAERVIQSALADLKHGRTTIVVAHRLATVLSADLIHVIDGGRAVESGTHAELLARGGIYARLYDLQFEGKALAETSA